MRELVPFSRSDRWPRRPGTDLFDRFFNEVGRPTLFGEDDRWFNPSVDVSETEASIIVKAEIPGMNKEDIDISLSDGVLTLAGEKKHEREEKKENYHFRESRAGSFRRTVQLGADVDPETVEASYRDGVLKVIVPKPEKSRPRKIDVRG